MREVWKDLPTPETHNKWSLASATGELIFNDVKVPKIIFYQTRVWTWAPFKMPLDSARYGIAWVQLELQWIAMILP